MLEYTKETIYNKNFNKILIAFCCDIIVNYVIKKKKLTEKRIDNLMCYIEYILF